jgi:histidine triad (HIT) family protein
VVLLDGPTANLDPAGARLVGDVLAAVTGATEIVVEMRRRRCRRAPAGPVLGEVPLGVGSGRTAGGPGDPPLRAELLDYRGGCGVSDCPFCAIGRGEIDADLVAYRSRRVFVIPTLMQREKNPGHTLVLPVAHVDGLRAASADLLRELFEVVANVSAAVRDAYGAVGSTVMQNNDIPGQVLHHLHVSVIPRFPDDAFRIPEPSLVEGPRDVRLERASLLREVLAPPG